MLVRESPIPRLGEGVLFEAYAQLNSYAPRNMFGEGPIVLTEAELRFRTPRASRWFFRAVTLGLMKPRACLVIRVDEIESVRVQGIATVRVRVPGHSYFFTIRSWSWSAWVSPTYARQARELEMLIEQRRSRSQTHPTPDGSVDAAPEQGER